MDYVAKQDILGGALDRLTYQLAKGRGEEILFGPAAGKSEVSFEGAGWLFHSPNDGTEYTKGISDCSREELLIVAKELFSRTQSLLEKRAEMEKRNEELSLELSKLLGEPVSAGPKLEQKDLYSLIGG